MCSLGFIVGFIGAVVPRVLITTILILDHRVSPWYEQWRLNMGMIVWCMNKLFLPGKYDLFKLIIIITVPCLWSVWMVLVDLVIPYLLRIKATVGGTTSPINPLVTKEVEFLVHLILSHFVHAIDSQVQHFAKNQRFAKICDRNTKWQKNSLLKIRQTDRKT